MLVHLVQLAVDNLRGSAGSPTPEKNRERAAQLVRDAGVPPQSLIVLPELFSTGILPSDFDAAGVAGIADTDRTLLAGLARETQSYVLGGILGADAEAPGKSFNLAVLFDPVGAEIMAYRKIHPFSPGGENAIFSGGDAVATAPVEGFTLQAAVCYDLRFPELFRAGARRGADLIAVPANWPESRRTHWEVLLRARAIENQSFVIGVNCTGVQRGISYAGGSIIVSPKGEVIAAGGSDECVVSAEIAARDVHAWRKAFPVQRDRRPDAFWAD